MTTFQTGYKSYLTEYINTTATTIPVSTLPTATNGRMMIYQGTIQEWIDYTGVTGSNPTGSLTGCSRGMSQTAEPSTSGTGLEWPAGSQIINVQMHDQIVSKGLPLPIIALTTTERDAIDMGNDYFDESNPIIYNTTAGEYQYWNGSAWASFATGTVPDATNLVGGKVKLSTADPGNTGVVLNSTDPKYAALAGTSGTPSGSNKYVTNDDTATDATADKVARRLAGGNITVVTEAQGDNSTKAASTAYVDGVTIAQGQVQVTSGGTTTIAHGLGRTPKMIEIFATGRVATGSTSTVCMGTATSTSNETCTYMYSYNSPGTGVGQNSSHIIFISTNGGAVSESATLTTLNSTNIVLTWDNSTGITVNLQYKAY